MRSLKMQSMTPKSVLNPYRPLAGLRVFLLAALLVGWGAVHAETNLDDLASEGIEKIKQEKATKEAAETEKLKQAEEAKRKAEKEVADKAAAKKNEQAEAERKASTTAKPAAGYYYLYAIPLPQDQAAAKAEPDLAFEKAAETKPPSLSGGYTINGDGTVTDTKTKLTWKQCSEGQSGKNCSSGKAEIYKWDDAMAKFGKNVSFASHDGWRMPTVEELRTLVYCSNGITPQEWSCADEKAGNYQSPTINMLAFPNTPTSLFWSSSPEGGEIRFVDFQNGYGWYAGSSNESWHVRLVSSSQ